MTDSPATRRRKKFRELLARKTITVMPGGFSPLYARVAEEAGFESFFLAGSQLSAFLYGVPDNGIIGLRDVVDHSRHMAARTEIPIFVDADTGYGNAVNVHYAVQEFIWAGVAGLQIEDQVFPKRCGHFAGKDVISCAEMVANVLQIVVAPGDSVAAGDTLLLLESMKMEIPVLVDAPGTVGEVRVTEGDVVQEGDVLVVLV